MVPSRVKGSSSPDLVDSDGVQRDPCLGLHVDPFCGGTGLERDLWGRSGTSVSTSVRSWINLFGFRVTPALPGSSSGHRIQGVSSWQLLGDPNCVEDGL